MKETPNPFLLVDNFLLDYIYNPLVWWSDEQFKKDGGVLTELAMLLFYAMCAVVFLAIGKSWAMIYVFPVLWIWWMGRGTIAASYHVGNWTGKNVYRPVLFPLRLLVCLVSLSFYVAIWMPRQVPFGPATPFAVSGVSVVLLSIVYIFSTDATPPRYRATKLTPRIA